MTPKKNKHYLFKEIAESRHHIVIHIAGLGGTGSHMLTNLAAINTSLIGIERQPLHIVAFDDDVITAANIGRQMFSPADVGYHKAKILVERINRFYGFQWESESKKYECEQSQFRPDILISCVDSVEARKSVRNNIISRSSVFYWMDIGNNQRSGQIILGTSANHKRELPDFFDRFPNIKDDPNDNTPSCSAMESLAHQDLFINKIMATMAANMLWTLLKNYWIDYCGLYINLETMQINKIPVA